jgi:hypothetical protein
MNLASSLFDPITFELRRAKLYGIWFSGWFGLPLFIAV